MKHSVYPWLISFLLLLYIVALNYFANTQAPPLPTYDFYDSTLVTVRFGEDSLLSVSAKYNNVLEGNRRTVSARREGPQQDLFFRVNSPRPAVLYINEQAHDIFLMPGDTSLLVDLMPVDSIMAQEQMLLGFEGKASQICHYYQARRETLGQMHIRARGQFLADTVATQYFNRLDSLAAEELVFLVQHEVFSSLPDWFVASEKNDILYQKAYLKLARAYNADIPASKLDNVTLDNDGAVFSYYYYLYLASYFESLIVSKGMSYPTWDHMLRERLRLADSLLTGDQHDVCMARLLFQELNRSPDELQLVGNLLKEYGPTFYRQKYLRFIKDQWKKQLGRNLVR